MLPVKNVFIVWQFLTQKTIKARELAKQQREPHQPADQRNYCQQPPRISALLARHRQPGCGGNSD
jgi:hypothetical protein